MAKKFIPAEVLIQCMNLSIPQVEAVIEGAGGNYKLSKATFMGMMSNGAFVYACEGDNLPAHIKEFKIGVAYEPNYLENFKPEFKEKHRIKVLGSGCRIYWK